MLKRENEGISLFSLKGRKRGDFPLFRSGKEKGLI